MLLAGMDARSSFALKAQAAVAQALMHLAFVMKFIISVGWAGKLVRGAGEMQVRP